MTKPTTPLPDEVCCGKARPNEQVLEELMDPCRPKNELEWCAVKHIQSQAERIADLEIESRASAAASRVNLARAEKAEARVKVLEDGIKSIIPRLNIVTACHRHGAPQRAGAMANLCNAQLEMEAALRGEGG